MYASRHPDQCLNVVLRTWLMKGPFISLYVSGALYSAGLCLFAISSKQVMSNQTFYDGVMG